jgi:hypothetical protein
MHASPRQEGHTMLKVIEHTAPAPFLKRIELHAVDFIDMNLETTKKVLLVLTYVGAVATVAAIILRVF